MKLENFKNKKILVLGLGKEGVDALNFFKKKFPNQVIGAGDKDKNKKKSIKKINYYLGEKYLSNIKKYDVIIKSPGIPVYNIKKLISKNQILTSPSDIFLNNCQGLIIGVTGTKGKSTTSSLIYNILKSNKINVSLIGNIGNPTLKHLFSNKETKVYVYELSSFQLATITKSPDIAVFLNIFKDHLDYHKDFKEYVKAKEKIFKFQTKDNFLIYNKNDKLLKKIIKKSKSIKIPFNYKDNNFEVLKIIGELFQVPKSKIKKEFKEFKNLPHRREYVGKKKEIYFYNDSAATIPEATVFAIEKIKKIDTLIVGGKDKGFCLDNLCNKIIELKINNIIYFPETGIKIAKKISKKSKKKNLIPVYSMKEAVSIAFQKTKKGKVCLLSPGASSLNMFKNLKERGNLFKRYVQKT